MTPDPVAGGTRTEGDSNVSQVWLDALARGSCDEEGFLRAIQMLTRRSPEAAWDSLALLDQYYRRGKIKAEVFKRVKSRLGAQLLGPALDVELSVPLKRQGKPPAVMVPVPPSATPPAATPSAPTPPAATRGSAAPPTAAPTAAPPPPTAARPAATRPAAYPPAAYPPAAAPSAAAPPAAAPPAAAPPAAAPPAAAPSAAAPSAAAPPAAAPPAAVTPVSAPPFSPAPPATLAPAPVTPAEPAIRPVLWVASPRSLMNSPSSAAPAPSRPGFSNGRTVPIGVERSVPLSNAAYRPAAEVKRGSPRDVTVGDVLRDRYVIKNVLGLGGTGTVFEAIDRYRLDLPDSGQRVAVKILHADSARQSAVMADLRREFQLLQSLSHPNIVRAHEYDRDGDTAFFTMEYLSGLSLEGVLAAHREAVLERAHALTIIRDVAAALEHAHSRGVVHGDLNPGNIFITNDGGIRVLDFGTAHTPSESPSLTESEWDATAYATLRFASCQLLDGERPDARDDTYSLACVLYVLLAGKHPFGELNAAQARAQRLKPARPRGLTGKQWHALRAALSFDRQRRPADIAAWLEPFDLPKPEARLPVLLALLKAGPGRPRRSVSASLIVLVLVLAAAGWWVIGHMDVVSQIAGDASGDLKDALAGANAAVTRFWQQPPSAESSSPAAQPPAAAQAVEEGTPAGAKSPEPSPTIPRTTRPRATGSSSISANAPASRPAPPHTAAPSMAASAAAAQPSHARIELSADDVEVPLTDPAAHVLVKRTGNLHADAGFTWWTESGTAKSGQDFMSVKPHEEHFEQGKSVINLFVPVVSDPTRKQAKSFYIVINDPSDGASLGKRTLTMVTIPPSE